MILEIMNSLLEIDIIKIQIENKIKGMVKIRIGK